MNLKFCDGRLGCDYTALSLTLLDGFRGAGDNHLLPTILGLYAVVAVDPPAQGDSHGELMKGDSC